MRLLALETSGFSGGAAAYDGVAPPVVEPFAAGQRSAQALAPAVRKVLARAGWQPSEVDVVGVTVGPGSFTGLRIGVTAAKTFSYVWKADLIAVDTLDVLARRAPFEAGSIEGARLHAVVDAHRGELFTAMYERTPEGRWHRLGPTTLLSVEAWLGLLQPGDAATGPLLLKLAPRMPAGVKVVPPALGEPCAGAVAELAAELHAAGRRDDLWTLLPEYGRLAAAEEKRLAAEPPL